MRSRLFLTLGAALLLALACDNASGPGVTLQVTPDSVQLVRNDSVRLAVNAVDGEGHLVTGVPVQFTSNDTTVVTVTNLGVMHSHTTLGRTVVRVRGGGAFTDVSVSVYATPSYIFVGPTDTLISRTQALQMHATVYDAQNLPITGVSPTWESSDPLVASITATGLVRAETSGTAFIIARFSPAAGTARVRVRGPSAIFVTPSDTSIPQGDSVQFSARVVDQVGDSIPGVTVTWQSSDTAVATMNATTGLARAVGSRSGFATIRAQYGTIVGQANLVVRDTIVLGNRVALSNQPFGAAVSANHVAYVTLGQAAQLARTDLPSQAFVPAVAVGFVPTEVVFNSTGSRAYVTNQFSENVGVVDVATNTQIGVIPVNGDPFELIVQPGDSILYVATNANTVYGIRLATKEVVATISTGGLGNGMLIRDSLLYITTHTNGRLIEFNLRTRTVARTFTLGGVPQKIAISADGNTLYIANEADRINGYVQFWDRINGTQIGGNIPLAGAFGYDIARRPTNGFLYVSTAYSGRIYVIDPATRTIIYDVFPGGSTRTIIFDTNGVAFVTNEAGWVDFLK